MATYTRSAEELKEGSLVVIRGKLGFSRLTKFIEGAELEASNNRKIQNGMRPTDKPHTTATIFHAEVVYKDPANPTIEEQFVAERRYTSDKRSDTGMNYSIDSKGSTLPVIAIPTDAGQVIQDTSGQELAQGLDVLLVLRVYKPKGFNNRGLALEQVIVNEPVQYYTSNTTIDQLAERGIIYAAAPQAIQADPPQSSTATPNIPGTVIDENGFALPAPTAPVVQEPNSPDQASTQTETLEQKVARLEAENAAMKDVASAVGAPAVLPADPWGTSPSGNPGITYQG